MSKRFKLIAFSILAIAVTAVLPGCSNPGGSNQNVQPISVVSVTGPIAPNNPGGPVVEITLKNVSNQPITSLVVDLQLGLVYSFAFDINSSKPLLPGNTIVSTQTLFEGAFSSDLPYPFNIIGMLQNGTSFDYVVQEDILAP